MNRELREAVRYAREVAASHPAKITRAPIGRYWLYEDSHVRVRISDQITLEDFAIWTPHTSGETWAEVLRWSPYEPQPDGPQVFRPGNGIPYLGWLASAKSHARVEWRAAQWTETPSFWNRAAGLIEPDGEDIRRADGRAAKRAPMATS